MEDGDVLHYWIYVQHGVLGYRLENQKYIATGVPNGIAADPIEETTISVAYTSAIPLKDELTPNNCKISITKLRGKDTCSGSQIFEEHFDNDIDSKWKHEVLIPLETEVR